MGLVLKGSHMGPKIDAVYILLMTLEDYVNYVLGGWFAIDAC